MISNAINIPAFVRMKASRELLEKAAIIFREKYGGEIIILSEEEAKNIPLTLLKAISYSHFIILVYGSRGRDCKDEQKVIQHIHQFFANRSFVLPEVTRSFFDHIRILSYLSSSIIHNYIAIGNYIDLYQKIKNQMPKEVFEAGFGRGHYGQLLYCCLNEIVFNGVDAEPKASDDLEELKQVLSLLGVRFDFQKYSGSIFYDTKLEDVNLDRQFPLVYSNNVMEHVENPEVFLAEIFNLVSNDGIFIANIGLDGHGYGDNPYDFLYLSEDEWRRYREESINYTVQNRFRCDDWLALFKKVGFSKIEHNVISRMKIPPGLQEKYDNRDISAKTVRFECYKD